MGGTANVSPSLWFAMNRENLSSWPQRRQTPRTGFSLFELLVVILIISVSLGLFLGFNYRQQESTQLRAQAYAVGQLMQAAKSTAIVQGETNTCLYDPEKNTIRTTLKERSQRLPEDIFLLVNDRRVEKETKIAVFYAQGSAVAEKVAVTSQGRKHTVIIQVDPLYGKIHYSDK